ncbi:MAG: hypothetical protein GC154_18980 [bacterium]|nr:hypothetical protein [bacterium]
MRYYAPSIVLFAIFASTFSWGQPVINEIMYNSSVDGLEYIELYNPGPDAADLTGWTLKDNVNQHEFKFTSGARINADAYYVVTDHASLFQQTYGVKADQDGVSFNFSNSGDAVRLYNASKTLIESVEYDDNPPWPEEADGVGPSLERRNPRAPANLPQSWAASTGQGTPGKRNSTYTAQLEPLISEIDHYPRLPAPGEDVTVTARVTDIENQVSSVRLYYGMNRGTTYTAAAMYDDGQHGDGEANDGVYGATISGGSTGDILRFYVQARNTDNLTALSPADGPDLPCMTVFARPVTGESVSFLQVVMRPEVNQDFLARYQTDEYFPATFYDGDNVYYQVQIRHRGRSRIQNGRFKIKFPQSQLYRGKIRRLNFNGTDTATIIREYLSFQLYQDAGLPNMETELVRLHINGESTRGTPYRVCIENPDSAFLQRRDYFLRDDGNLYKTTLDGTPQNKATWRYIGDDPALYSGCYIKQTNEEEADYSDVIRFCKTLEESEPWEPDFQSKVYSVLNTDDFIRWMAVSACVAHWDSPFTDHGQNYILYNNPATGQFHVLAWDLNGTFNYTSNQNDLNYRKLYTHIRSTKLPAINKILSHPVFGAQYYREIDQLMNSLFSQSSMDARIDRARDQLKLSNSSVSFLKTYVRQRNIDMANWINHDQGVAFITEPAYQANIKDVYRYRATAVDYRANQPVTYSLSQSPGWLSVDEKSGELFGVPTEGGEFPVRLDAKTKGGVTISQTFTIAVEDSLPRLLVNFNEPGSAIQDHSTFQNNGTLRGSASKTTGRLGNGVILSSNAYATIPQDDSLNLTGAITVEAWIRPNSISNGNPTIITKGNTDEFNYTLMLGYGPWNWDAMEPCFMPHRFDIENRVYYGRKEIEARLQNRQWVHIAGTYDSSQELVGVYANNYRIVKSAARCEMVVNTSQLSIGVSGSLGFQGVVDDIKILPFAKSAFAAGLCLSSVDAAAVSSAQQRISLSLSEYRDDAVDTGGFCLYAEPNGEWLKLPSQPLRPGQTVSFWLDDLGLETPLGDSGSISLYPINSFGDSAKETILDYAAWGAPAAMNEPAVSAGVWLPGRAIALNGGAPKTLSLKQFADNDDMDEDWQALPQQLEGPVLSAFQVENGAAAISHPNVTLNLTAGQSNAPKTMRISNSPVFTDEWKTYSKTANWTLSPGDGIKTVYIQVADGNGERSPVYTDTIELRADTMIQQWRRIQ